MPQRDSSAASRRVATSDDLEISAYLEIAEGKLGQVDATDQPQGAEEAIVVLDYGSQYSRLIARRVRECRVYCEIHPHDVGEEQLAHLNVKGFILSGGPSSVYDAGAPQIIPRVLEGKAPVLGICYGMQALAYHLGGKVAPTPVREYGHAVLHQDASGHPLFADLPPSLPVWMSHGDQVLEPPPGLPVDGVHGELAHRRHGERRGGDRAAVPPGGRAHARRAADHRQLPAARVRVSRHVDARQLHRRHRKAGARAGGRGTGHLRAVGRGGLRRDGNAGAPRRGEPTDVHLRRQRPAAPRGA